MYINVKEYTEMHKSILKSILRCATVYWNVEEYTRMCKNILRCAIVYWNVQ